MAGSRQLVKAAGARGAIGAADNGPVAKIVPYQAGEKRELGWARGEFTVPENFNDPIPEIEDLFYRCAIDFWSISD